MIIGISVDAERGDVVHTVRSDEAQAKFNQEYKADIYSVGDRDVSEITGADITFHNGDTIDTETAFMNFFGSATLTNTATVSKYDLNETSPAAAMVLESAIPTIDFDAGEITLKFEGNHLVLGDKMYTGEYGGARSAGNGSGPRTAEYAAAGHGCLGRHDAASPGAVTYCA